MQNCLQLDGVVLREEPLRYTPAGLPTLQCWLQHRSRQNQTEFERQVFFEIQTVIIGPQALNLASKLAGKQVSVSGFIAQRSQRNTRLVLHVQDIIINY